MKWTDQSPPDTLARLSEWPDSGRPVQRVLCSEDSPGCRAHIAQAVHRKVLSHLCAAPVEQGGLLLGIPLINDAGDPSRIVVLDAVAAELSSGTGFSLRMEAAVWSAANQRLNQLNSNTPDDSPMRNRIVGWYHSHPGLGAFFSHTDMSTQAAFFNHRYSIGWVIDPSDDSHAMFLGAASQPIAAELTDA